MMNDHQDSQPPIDGLLRRSFQDGTEPEDGGFTLSVMAALPGRDNRGHQRWARHLLVARWSAISLAACATALLLAGPVDEPHAWAALALMGLLIFWSVPSRWNPA